MHIPVATECIPKQPKYHYLNCLLEIHVSYIETLKYLLTAFNSCQSLESFLMLFFEFRLLYLCFWVIENVPPKNRQSIRKTTQTRNRTRMAEYIIIRLVVVEAPVEKIKGAQQLRNHIDFNCFFKYNYKHWLIDGNLLLFFKYLISIDCKDDHIYPLTI